METCYEICAETSDIIPYILLKHKVFENFISGTLLGSYFAGILCGHMVTSPPAMP